MINLSIIIPHFNSPDSLKKLLQSIPNLPQVQTIVVDDHSTAGLEELEECRQEFFDSNVEFYTNECKKSAGGARNTALKYAKGKWLLFADADDYFVPDFYHIVEKYYEESYDLVYFIPTSVDLDTKQLSDRHFSSKLLIRTYLENPTKRNCLRMKYMIVGPVSMLVRRDLVTKYGIQFDEQLVANDVMAITKIAFHAKSVFASDEVIYCITKQAGTLTTVHSEERSNIRTEVFFRRYHYLKEHLPKNEYRMIHFNARDKLKQIMQYKLGREKYFQVLGRMLREGVPIWREFSPMYYYYVVHYLLNKDKYLK